MCGVPGKKIMAVKFKYFFSSINHVGTLTGDRKQDCHMKNACSENGIVSSQNIHFFAVREIKEKVTELFFILLFCSSFVALVVPSCVDRDAQICLYCVR